MNFSTSIKSYFGARNGYDGFKSYFNSIFSPEKFARIFVLKGGPGSGKSTLMKKTANYFAEKGVECDVIYCSSDPKSLDGIIINGPDKKVAVLDGTAPHETDAKMPGAFDEIVNLGETWNSENLIKNRKIILDINQNKKRHYDRAYRYLRLAGEYSRNIFDLSKSIFDFDKAEFEINKILSKSNKMHGRSENFKIISSFGKDGYLRNIQSFLNSKDNFSLKGTYQSEYIFTDLIKKHVFADTIFISPFCEDLSEGVQIGDALYLIGDDFENAVDTSLLFKENLLSREKDTLEYFTKQKEELLRLSSQEFGLASKSHFMLEEIYSKEIDFRKINRITSKLINDTEKIIYQ